MNELFNSKPAKFPSYNTEEQNSVYKLLDIINKNVIKPDPKIIDKFPNTDGEFTITDIEQFPIGKLEIQIKTLPSSDIEKPKYQCELPFLKHCETSLLPVLLVAVNAEHELAYWLHLSRDLLLNIKKKIKGKSVSIDFPKSNIIKRSESLYIEEWTKIVRSYIRRKVDSEAQEYYRVKYEELYQQLIDFPKPTHTIGAGNLKKISLFIDKLNNCLDNEFQALKEVRYHNFWKLSITYTSFKNNTVSYAIIPIKYGENDLLIREALNLNPFKDIKDASFIHGYNGKNPIKISPIEHAYEIISKGILEIIKEQNLVLLCEELAIEYATDFFDYHEKIFPLQFEGGVSVEMYLKVAQKYFPIWIEEYHKHKKIAIVNEVIYINLDDIFWHLLPEDIETINAKALFRFENGESSNYQIKDQGKETSLEYLIESLQLLDKIPIKNLCRPFKCQKYRNESGWVWSNFTPQSAFEKIQFVYKALPKVYDTFIESFFPMLYKELDFFAGSNLLIVNISYKESFHSLQDGPVLELFYLKNDQNTPPIVKVYLNYIGCPIQPESRFEIYDTGIIIDSVEYKLKTGYSGGPDFLYDRFTLRNTMNDMLLRRFKNYFKTKTS